MEAMVTSMNVDSFDDQSQFPPLGVLTVAVVVLGTNAILIRWSAAPSVIKGMYRLFLTTLILLPPTAYWHRAELWSLIFQRDTTRIVGAGVALAINTWSFFESLEWTSVAATVILGQTQIVFVAIGGYFLLGETLTVKKGGGMLVAFAGVVVMSISGLLDESLFAGAAPLYGNGLAMISGATFAGYLLIGRSVRQRVSLFPYVIVVYGVSSAVLIGFAFLGGATIVLTKYPQREIILFFAMAVGPGIVGHSLLNWVLEHVESNIVSAGFLGVPIVSTLLAVVLLDEIPGVPTAIGGAIVLVGIYITTQ